MSQQLKQAMNHLIHRHNTDWYKVAVEYAKQHPTSFNRTMKREGPESWTHDVLQMRTKIEAIKAVRAATGWNLKQAKDWCDDNWRDPA